MIWLLASSVFLLVAATSWYAWDQHQEQVEAEAEADAAAKLKAEADAAAKLKAEADAAAKFKAEADAAAKLKAEADAAAKLKAEAGAAAKLKAEADAAAKLKAGAARLAEQEKLKPGSVFRDKFEDDFEGPEMVVIPAGAFRMSQGRGYDVKITKSFAMSKFEVTYDEYNRFTGATGRTPLDDHRDRGNAPVLLAWNDAVAYIAWLSERTGKRYRLPSEAEWEYAARAGTTTNYWWGDEIGENRANCSDCGSLWDRKRTAPVGSFMANAFGLHDTAGNAWEWTQDCWSRNYGDAPSDGSAWLSSDCDKRVVRGGSYYNGPSGLRSSNRSWGDPLFRSTGLRLARDLD